MGVTTETTKGRLAAIARLWRPRITTSDIALALSRIEQKQITRNVVIGLYSRYGKDQLKAYPLQAPSQCVRGRRRKDIGDDPIIPKPYRKRVQTEPRPPKPKSNVVPFVLPESVFTYVPTHPTKRLLDLEAHECRWAMSGAGEDIQFCAQHAEGSYCEHHRRMSIGQGTRSERMAVRAARRLA